MHAEVKRLVLSLCQSFSYMCTSSIQHWYCLPFLIWYDRYGGDWAYMDSKHLFVITSLIPSTLYCKHPVNKCSLEERLSVYTRGHLKSIHLTSAEIPLQDADSHNGGVADYMGTRLVQSCQPSRILPETHAFRHNLTLTRIITSISCAKHAVYYMHHGLGRNYQDGVINISTSNCRPRLRNGLQCTRA